MAPILFLFLMLTFSETLEQEYEQEWDINWLSSSTTQTSETVN
jgi:hypothetical protein